MAENSTAPRLRFRTPADVRSIENEQWERWLRDGTLPWGAFSADRLCQTTLRYGVAATQRRGGATA